jgi:drug/metabolite transporter (DMT)-like permease
LRWRETATLAYGADLHPSKPVQHAAAEDERAQAAAVRRKQSLALAILIFGALVVASSGVFVRLSQTGPTATAFWRGALALPAFALWILIDSRRKSERLSLRVLTPPDSRLFWAGACFGADLVFWHWSLLLTSIAASTLEANLAPMVVTLIAWVVWKERPSGKFLLALALALGGVGLIVSPKLGSHEGTLLGDALGLLTACFYGGYLAIVSRLRSAYSTGVVMFWTTFFYSLLVLPIALTQKFLPQDLHGWSLLLGLALIVHCLGQGLVAYALAHLPAAFGAVGLLVQPAAAGFYAWLFLGEQFASIQLVGGAVVLCAIMLARNATSTARVEPVQNRAP